MSDTIDNADMDDAFYTLVPEQGLCLVGEVIVNLKQIAVIRKLDGKTLVYIQTNSDPVILPARAFDQIRDAVFSIDSLDDDEFEDDEDELEGEE